jgi:hypothetical protein
MGSFRFDFTKTQVFRIVTCYSDFLITNLQSIMNLSFRTTLFIALVAAAGMTTASAQTAVSRLLPDKQYDVTIKKTLSGTDGFQEIAPSTSTQRMRIMTDPVSGGGIPAELTVYRTQQQGQAASDAIDWQFRFTVMADGTIDDLRVVSAAESTEESLAFAMLSRMLDPVLFNTGIALRRANKDQIVITRSTPRDGAANFVDVEYNIDFSASELEKGANREPIATDVKGTALFNTDLQFFTERTHNETSKIFVAEDALGSEKNVVMRRDLRIETHITDR